METGKCMNVACGATEPGGEWRRGWGLRSGGFASLCVKCGMAYEQLIFCDIFHQKESGWRECCSCGKHLHCGCIASKSFFDLLDTGGVQCINCIKNSEVPLMTNGIVQNFVSQNHQRVVALSARTFKEDIDSAVTTHACEMSANTADFKIDGGTFSKGKCTSKPDLEHSDCGIRSFAQIKSEQHSPDVVISSLSNRYQGPSASSQISPRDEKALMTDNSLCESLSQGCISMSLGNTNQIGDREVLNITERSFLSLPMACSISEGKDERKASATFQQMQRPRSFVVKCPRTSNQTFSDLSKNSLPYMRVARPPAEGRNQLLPRYWPRITDQELQQISGDSNSTIVPLFEKVLSASDAGRIGRLVLPKACAEAYFPPISQPEGVPLTIQDTKGKEWHFQFRFWPNNNSRMYVLEGVTPCIQSLQLQAGDTVTFSRIDPEGKLVMGYRKATNTVPLQDCQISAIANGTFGNETLFSGIDENMTIANGYSGLLQSMKGAIDPYLASQPEHLNQSDLDVSWHKGGRSIEGLLWQPLQSSSRNIGSKSKRLLMDTEDALELKMSWEEAQELLRPPPSAKPSIVTIEDHEIEEYEEPPIFGKKTIFTARSSGEQDQWVQCDDCFKWRHIPIDVLLHTRWSCVDNVWDPKRSSCSAPDELSQKEMQLLLRQYEDFRQQSACASWKRASSELVASSLDAFAAVAAVGDVGNQSMTTYSTTTKHPRHRPGCTCIVCIQPPSGKGPKHDPSCTCNVCMTVKRRFKTLMMRKKKRQSEREEAEAHKKVAWNKEEAEGTSSSSKGSQHPDLHQENEFGHAGSRVVIENPESSKEGIDLNCDPGRNEDSQTTNLRLSMMSLLQNAQRPLEMYLKQNGLASLVNEQGSQESPSSLIPETVSETEGKATDESHFTSTSKEQGAAVDEDAKAEADTSDTS
ncbi:B3 domain-containing protein Os07g0679700-like isoform X1 [Zingiber officinale]|uniref:B3 domain-containing protein Os07g0679700-like isoform X1 n=2 Tax=Zingiber officinale TaxID=94328 RepID=UPI001C4D8F58|nr:B3 domain-containing protein Os07g0679700-like isoform X1 [Zingiber officinale]